MIQPLLLSVSLLLPAGGGPSDLSLLRANPFTRGMALPGLFTTSPDVERTICAPGRLALMVGRAPESVIAPPTRGPDLSFGFLPFQDSPQLGSIGAAPISAAIMGAGVIAGLAFTPLIALGIIANQVGEEHEDQDHHRHKEPIALAKLLSNPAVKGMLTLAALSIGNDPSLQIPLLLLAAGTDLVGPSAALHQGYQQVNPSLDAQAVFRPVKPEPTLGQKVITLGFPLY